MSGTKMYKTTATQLTLWLCSLAALGVPQLLLTSPSVDAHSAVVLLPQNILPKMSRLCGPGEIFLRRGVQTPGCYRRVHLQEACQHSRQCIETDSFCGLNHLTNLTEQTVCVCRDDTKEVADIGGGSGRHCEVRHLCSIGHFNRNHLQADCPKASMFCDRHRCLCRPAYTYDRVADDCLPEQAEEATEEKTAEEKTEEEKTEEEKTAEEKTEVENAVEEIIRRHDGKPNGWDELASGIANMGTAAKVGLIAFFSIVVIMALAWITHCIHYYKCRKPESSAV